MKQKYLLLLLLVLVATALQYKQYVLRYEADHIYQIKFASNFINGDGISISIIDTTDWAVNQPQVIGDWAPGFPIVLAPLLKVFDSHIEATSFLAFLLILLIFLSLGLMFRNTEKKTLLAIFLPLSICYAPFRYVSVSGLASLGFLLFGVFLVQYWLEKQHRKDTSLPLYYFVATGIVLFLPSFFRFAYYPTGFILLGSCFIYIRLIKVKVQTLSAVTATLFLCIATGLQLIYQSSIQNVNFLENKEGMLRDKLIYFENLKLFNPITLNTFFPTSIWENKLWSSGLPSYYVPFTHTLSLLFFAVILYSAYIFWKDYFGRNKKTSEALPLFHLTTISIGVILFLVLLSLYYPAWKTTHYRTFVKIARYFAPFSLLLILYISISFFKCKHFTVKSLYIVFILFNLAAYANSVRVYGVGNILKQVDIMLPKRLGFLQDVSSLLSQDKTNIILADNTEEAIAVSITHPLGVGQLAPYLKQAEQEKIYVSKPTQLLVLAYWAEKEETLARLQKAFGEENVQEIPREESTPVIWQVMLYPEN